MSLTLMLPGSPNIHWESLESMAKGPGGHSPARLVLQLPQRRRLSAIASPVDRIRTVYQRVAEVRLGDGGNEVIRPAR